MKKIISKNSEDDISSGGIEPPLWAALGDTKLAGKLDAMRVEGSRSHRELAEFVLRHPAKVAASSIEDIARISGISPPTISRFAREMGFSGYAALRSALAEAVQGMMDPVAKLREQIHLAPQERRGGTLFAAIRDELGLCDARGLETQLTALAERIRASRAVHVMGFGLSAHIAGLLVLGLQPYHPAVVNVVEYGGTEVAAGRLMALDARDLVIAITVPRYASDVVRLSRFAKDRGAHLVVITDSPASPLAPLADTLLLAPARHPVLSSSLVSALAIAETLVAALMLSDPENVERADKLTEAISGYLHRDR
ncbi:MAG: MurR/RpiR family transcriptional regulator [Rhabdaerophilum sp.]